MSSNRCHCDDFIFDNFTNDLNKEINQITRKKQDCAMDNYNKDVHWKKMRLCCELISKECTKMSLAFAKPPLPSKKDSTLLLEGIAKSVDMLLAWYKCFPLCEGKLLHKALQSSILSILTSVGTFTDVTLNSQRNSDILKSTGTIWEHCDKFGQLPSDNTNAAIECVDSSNTLVTDAITEIKQALLEFEEEELNDIDDEGDADDDKWTTDDKKLFKPVLGLMMASKGLLKKIKTALKKTVTTVDSSKNSHGNEIDELILNHVENISPCVDDFVLLMYPPVDKEQLLLKGNELSQTLSNTLLFLKNSTFGKDDDDQSWIAFIQKAVEHNQTILKSLLGH